MERMQAKARARYALAEFLGGSGKRCTPERLLILDVAVEQRKPFTAEELLRKCAESGAGLSLCRATLFNTLPLLVQAGVLRHNIANHSYVSVRTATANKPRLNLVCSICGKVHHRKISGFGSWVSSQDLRGFSATPEGAEVYIYGECSMCRRKLLASKTKNSITK